MEKEKYIEYCTAGFHYADETLWAKQVDVRKVKSKEKPKYFRSATRIWSISGRGSPEHTNERPSLLTVYSVLDRQAAAASSPRAYYTTPRTNSAVMDICGGDAYTFGEVNLGFENRFQPRRGSAKSGLLQNLIDFTILKLLS